MHEGHAGSGQRRVLRLDVIDLDRKGDTGTIYDFPSVKEDREVGIVAHRRGFSLGDLEFDFEAQMVFVPIVRLPPISNRQRRMIEPGHTRRLPSISALRQSKIAPIAAASYGCRRRSYA